MSSTLHRFSFLALTAVLLLVSCTNYGDKVSKDYMEVYYKNGITKEQAEKTLELLHPIWKSQDGSPDQKKSVQLTKTADTINFRMVVNPQKLGSVSDDIFHQMANEFSVALFNNAPVNVDLTDERFKLIRTLRFIKSTE